MHDSNMKGYMAPSLNNTGKKAALHLDGMLSICGSDLIQQT